MDVYNTSGGVCTTLAFSEFAFYSPNPIMAGKWYTLATGGVVYACYIISLGGGSVDTQVLTDERDTCNL
jgi:hypothetical protein